MGTTILRDKEMIVTKYLSIKNKFSSVEPDFSLMQIHDPFGDHHS